MTHIPDEDVPRLPPELKAKWVAALRSGAYQQATGALRTGGTCMCCLGVLCDVIDPESWRQMEGGIWAWGPEIPGRSHVHYLPADLCDRFGFNQLILDDYGSAREAALANRNDGVSSLRRWSFTEIADWIEVNL